jgi:dienelactone hydrolase
VDAEASVLATQGFNVLVFCYFDCGRALNGPRAMLRNVEASSVLDAVAWMRSQKNNNGAVAVYGFSRGAELAMIAGSLEGTPAQTPDALIAHSPSDVFNGPVSWDWFEPACWVCRKASCPAGSPNTDFYWNPSCGEANNPALVDFTLSAWLVHGKLVAAGTRIPVEKFSGPVLLTVGLKDELWPADQTKRIEATLRAVGTSVQAHYFPEGGHVLQGKDEIERRGIVLDFLSRL